MPTILVVEETGPDRSQIGRLLISRDYEVLQTDEAHGALEQMKEHTPDLVILDLQLPSKEILDLVSSLRENFPYVPIILITGSSNTKEAIEYLRRGASSYVPRRMIQNELVPTMRSLLNLVAPRRDRSELAEVMESCAYSFCLFNQYPLIASLVAYMEQVLRDLGTCDDAECVRVSVALLEALSNALYHGNLELDSSLREEDFDAYRAAALQRAQLPPYKNRKIFVECSLSRKKAVFVVRDEGDGFDPNSLSDLSDGPNLDKVSGRGIMLMRTMMDEVTFNKTGNQVTLVKYPPKPERT